MIEVKVYDTADIQPDGWRNLQALARDAIAGSFANSQRTPEEFDDLICWNEPDEYAAAQIDPNRRVGGSRFAGQEYRRPRAAVAYDSYSAVGFATVANNVSGGSAAVRAAKYMIPSKRYFAFGDIVVDPNRQGQGIAPLLVRPLLREAAPFQPVTAYVWPVEDPRMPEVLTELGFAETARWNQPSFGEDRPPIVTARMQAASARSVLAAMDIRWPQA